MKQLLKRVFLRMSKMQSERFEFRNLVIGGRYFKLVGKKPTQAWQEEIHCPVCGFYCLGKGGFGCIDKPNFQKVD